MFVEERGKKGGRKGKKGEEKGRKGKKGEERGRKGKKGEVNESKNDRKDILLILLLFFIVLYFYDYMSRGLSRFSRSAQQREPGQLFANERQQ